jgi:hypothetical protein
VTDDTCGSKGQIVGPNGRCKDCPPFKHPSNDARSCTFEVCTGNKILKEDGFCESCPAGKRPGDERRQCIKDTCIDNEINDDLGYCIECALLTRPNANRTQCISDTCVENQIKLVDGTCEDCEDYFHPDTEARNCIQCDMTGRERDIWLRTGECYSCPAKTYPGPNKHECMSDTCDEEREYLKDDGTCHQCEDFTYPDAESQQCLTDTCNDFQYKLISGKCFQCDENYWSWTNSSGSGCEEIPPPTPPACPVDTDTSEWGRDIDG